MPYAGGATGLAVVKLSGRSGGGARTVFVERTHAGSGFAVASGGVVPYAVFASVHGIPVGWAKGDKDWFVVYLSGRGNDWCGLGHDSWRIALVQASAPTFEVVADRRIGPAGCGNELSWVRTGRFSDGRHREAAFMLWTTPAIGATAYVYRLGHNRLHLLATFGGDRITLSRGRAVVGFENRGRGSHGELEDVYRFTAGRYRLVRRR